MSTTKNVKIETQPDTPDTNANTINYELAYKDLQRNYKKLENDKEAMKCYIEALEAKLARCEIVVKCVEALTGEKLGIW